jgi:hypothetical protein
MKSPGEKLLRLGFGVKRAFLATNWVCFNKISFFGNLMGQVKCVVSYEL